MSPRPGPVAADYERLHGSVDPLPEQRVLHAGPLAVILESGDLRSIRLGSHEIVNRIYGAVRDGEWRTIPGVISDLRVETTPDTFAVRYVSTHVADPVDFVWHATITGAADGTVTFRFAGEARASFARNRIGLCVLHPLRESLGLPARARHPDGSTSDVRFPVDVAVEQPVTGFRNLAGLRWGAAPGLDAELAFAGEVFETEDQRNWMDASFKTFGTPLALPRPVVLAPGTRVEQSVTLRLCPRPPGGVLPSQPFEPCEPDISPARAMAGRLGIALAAGPHTADAVRSLQAIAPAHLRVALALDGEWAASLARAVGLAGELGCDLELQLDVAPGSGPVLERLAAALPPDVRVARILVFAAGGPVTTAAALDLVQRRLLARRPHLAPLASGSRRNLAELHLVGAPLADVTCWGLHPQAHSVDVTTIAESPIAAGQQVRSVHRRRSGPVAVGVRLHPTGEDPRLRSLVGAAWTLATLSELAGSGADSVTAFETIGPAGLVSTGGAVVPAYHVVADFCELTGADAMVFDYADGRHAIRLEADRHDVFLVANVSRQPRRIGWPAGFRPHTIRLLDADSASRAMQSPADFRELVTRAPEDGVTLAPFATARIDGVRAARRPPSR
jgi:hypothetical protein